MKIPKIWNILFIFVLYLIYNDLGYGPLIFIVIQSKHAKCKFHFNHSSLLFCALKCIPGILLFLAIINILFSFNGDSHRSVQES